MLILIIGLDYFFEAMVTVNLTGMLVLTTIFMSVSSNLPQTSYVKMIDIWLLFCILVPFCEVLLHTWMDSHRTERREVNHHGEARTVGDEDQLHNGKEDKDGRGSLLKDKRLEGWTKLGDVVHVAPAQDSRKSDLISRHEDVQVNALKKHYQEAEVRENSIKFGELVGRKVIPALVILFMILYWGYGLIYVAL